MGKTLCCLLLMALIARNHAVVVDVRSKGAKADGKTDDGPAIEKAWQAACSGGSSLSSVVIPPGTYMAYPPILFGGPCKGPVEIRATGATIRAPPELARFKSDSWIKIQHVDRLAIIGGTFDGQGQETWKHHKCSEKGLHCQIPVNLRFSYVTNSLLKDITSINSKFFHIALYGCDNTAVDHVTIVAPDDSINTDGIHISHLKGVNITNSKITTGDDCISFGDSTSNVQVHGLTCGPGHGVSIGSLGKYSDERPVQGIWIRNCTFEGTDNGVRIKTWAGSNPGMATDIHFEDIIMNNVENPILIDQHYCPHGTCKGKGSPSKVKISNVSFRRIRGTSKTKVALKFDCTEGLCENIEVSDIHLTFKGGAATSECSHVKPKVAGHNIPPAC